MLLYGLRGTAYYDQASGQMVEQTMPAVDATAGTGSVNWGALFAPFAQGVSQYATAQQTNQALSTLSTVAIWGVVAWAAVSILARKK